MVVCGLGKEERADQQQGGSDTRAVLDEWEMEKRAQCFEMGDGAAGMPRWSRLLQNIFVIFGCGLELLELLLVWKLLLHIHSPEPHGRDFWLTALHQGKGEHSGVSRATNLSLGLLTWEERSSLPLFCPKPGVFTVPPDLTPPPPIAWV